MKNKLRDFFTDKNVLILGFGMEGRSTYRILSELNCARGIAIADQNNVEGEYDCEIITGDGYLDVLDSYDIVMKSPGIALMGRQTTAMVTSQTDLLLKFCDCKIVGITGTKGKSTTSSLLYHILCECEKKAMLIGNIGVPPLERIDEYTPDMTLVCEMSCHQLEYLSASPDIAVLLNIYEEHLDHYVSFDAYQQAKLNIMKFQSSNDLLIYSSEIAEELINSSARKITASKIEPADIYLTQTTLVIPNHTMEIPQLKTKLIGRHNLYNIGVALSAAVECGCDFDMAVGCVKDFRGLAHRLEEIGTVGGVRYINDSISTIPNATISALQSISEVDTLIVGGMERGISYTVLVDFLETLSTLSTLIVLPDCGYRIADEICEKYTPVFDIYKASDMEDAVSHAKQVTKKCCLLSPAAASYGFYKNFEERGNHFRKLVLT